MHQDECDVEQRLGACLELLDRMEELLIGFQPLSAEEVRHATKLPKDGGDHVVAEVARQCAAIDMARADRDTTVHGMLAALEEERLLRRVISRREDVLARLRGARGRAASESWRSALMFYALLRRLAANEPRMKAALEPVRQYFSERRLRPASRQERSSDRRRS